VLSPGQLVSVSTLTFLVSALDQSARLYAELGDARAFGVVHEHFRLIEDAAKREGGALVKTVGEGVLAAFREGHAAVRAAFALPGLLAGNPKTEQLRLRIAVHGGPAMAATLNDHLDYFGSSVNTAWRLLDALKGGEVLLTETVTSNPHVATFLHDAGLKGEIVDLAALDVGIRVGQKFLGTAHSAAGLRA
jgi:class 3 adenylate cyclase